MAHGVIKLRARSQYDEQHDTNIVSPALSNRDALKDFIEFFDLPVYLSGANAHAAGIQYRVRATMNDNAATSQQFGKITVRPHAGKPLEIGGTIAAVVFIVPETDRG